MVSQCVRIVCISDTHGQTPKLPAGDVLIHAGDLCQQGTPEELRKVIRWLEATNFQLKIIIAGNHDACLDPRSWKPQNTGTSAAVVNLLRSSSSIHYLEHESKLLRLRREDGTEVGFKVFGSPFTTGRRQRAFGYVQGEAASLWDQIPLDTDIVVTHTPAKHHLDESKGAGAVGCPQLREALWRVRPKLFVCGHIHEGRGAQVVEWDLDSPDVKFRERSLREIPDETGVSKKTFRVDLSSCSAQPLRNNGAPGSLIPSSARQRLRGVEVTGDGAFIGDELATQGQGGAASEICADQEALLGRENRLETCFVNASYIPTRNLSRSHRTGLILNKPVVVNVDFPLHRGADEWYANSQLWSLQQK